MTILGVDYSHWQAGVDPLKLIAGGVSFVIVKSGEWYGEDEYDDDRYTANMIALTSAGLPHGSYYFYHPKIGNSKQLRHWQRLWESQPHDFPPILDCETQDGMFRWDYDTETAAKIALQICPITIGIKSAVGIELIFSNNPEVLQKVNNPKIIKPPFRRN